jgi:hypothetical protein
MSPAHPPTSCMNLNNTQIGHEPYLALPLMSRSHLIISLWVKRTDIFRCSPNTLRNFTKYLLFLTSKSLLSSVLGICLHSTLNESSQCLVFLPPWSRMRKHEVMNWMMNGADESFHLIVLLICNSHASLSTNNVEALQTHQSKHNEEIRFLCALEKKWDKIYELPTNSRTLSTIDCQRHYEKIRLQFFY